MLKHLGYIGNARSAHAITDRSCRLSNASPGLLRRLIQSNLAGLWRTLRFNAANGILLYRISSKVIPFASHPAAHVPWWDDHSELFYELAQLIRRHDLRVSMHPGQFTVLNSPNPDVVAASKRELEWHVKFLECLKVGSHCKIVVHIGGAYGAKPDAMDRFVAVACSLPEHWLQRLAIENDERVFSVEDLLSISRRVALPVIFDWLHHQANPGRDAPLAHLISECFDTWTDADGRPKVHFSSPANGERAGRHADWIDANQFVDFLQSTPRRDFDCMLEAKCRDLALFRLRDELRIRGIT